MKTGLPLYLNTIKGILFPSPFDKWNKIYLSQQHNLLQLHTIKMVRFYCRLIAVDSVYHFIIRIHCYYLYLTCCSVHFGRSLSLSVARR